MFTQFQYIFFKIPIKSLRLKIKITKESYLKFKHKTTATTAY